MTHHRTLLLALAGTIALLAAFAATPTADAAAIIDNGLVQLGVDDHGQLNVAGGTPSMETGTTAVGLRYMPTNAESTAPGCLCEGWGVSYDNATFGAANNDFGILGCAALTSFTSTATTAVSVVTVCDLVVTHDYHPSPATPNLYEVDVTIENRGAVTHSDVRYRRVMDWDVEPTAFSEYSTIDYVGPAPPSELLASSDDGFATPNPLVPLTAILAFGPPGLPFTDSGPTDHGAAFDFGFGALAPGGSVSFQVFYGAARDEAEADTARAAAGVQLWSYGQPSDPGGPDMGVPNTFIFGFGSLTPNTCEGIAKTGRAFVAHAFNEDVGNTGFVGPANTWVLDTGAMNTFVPQTLSATLATHSGPLADAEILSARTTAHACFSEARTSAAHVVSGPALAPLTFEVRAGEVTSYSDCRGHSGTATIAYLMVNSMVLVDTTNQPPPNTKIYLGPVTVTLNEHLVTPGALEVNLVHIQAPGYADVRVLSAKSDIHGCGGDSEPPCGLEVGVDEALRPILGGCVPCDEIGPIPLPCDVCETGLQQCLCPAVPGVGGDGVVAVPCCTEPRTPVGLVTVAPGVAGPCAPCELPRTDAAVSSRTELALDCVCPAVLGVDVDPARPSARGYATLDCSPCKVTALEQVDGSVPSQDGAGYVYCDPCPLLPPNVAAAIACDPCQLGYDHGELSPTVAYGTVYADCGPCTATGTEVVPGVRETGVGTLVCDPCPLLPPGLASLVPCQPCTLIVGQDASAPPAWAFGFADLRCGPCSVAVRESVDGSVPRQDGDATVYCDPCKVLPPRYAGLVPCMPCRIDVHHEEAASPPNVYGVVQFGCGPCTITTGYKLDALTLTEVLFGDVSCHGCFVAGMPPLPDVCIDCDLHVDEDGVRTTTPVVGIAATLACPVPPTPPVGGLPVVGPVLAPVDPLVQAVRDALGI